MGEVGRLCTTFVEHASKTMSEDFRQLILQAARNFEYENNAAHDLWTWLPSYKVAQRFHGSKGIFEAPPIGDILTEASLFIACLKNTEMRDYSPEEKEWFERCPCGEEHTKAIL